MPFNHSGAHWPGVGSMCDNVLLPYFSLRILTTWHQPPFQKLSEPKSTRCGASSYRMTAS
jgi:hypothetical protein